MERGVTEKLPELSREGFYSSDAMTAQ
jgi:hypothetical protein